ncbi:unnamed protein product, partial [Discosporangium mesarthrocarpum]
MAGSEGNQGNQGRECVVVAEGWYTSTVLVSLDPAIPGGLRLVLGRGEGREEELFVLGAKDSRQRDLLVLTLRSRRKTALGHDVDDHPEATAAMKAMNELLEMKAAAVHFSLAFDEDGSSGNREVTSS